MSNKAGSGSIVVNAVHEHRDDKGGRPRLAADGDVVGRSVETITSLHPS